MKLKTRMLETINKLRYFIASAIACLAFPSDLSAAVMPTPGFNLGNTLESTWGYAPPTKELIDSIADAGFKTLRVPCAWDFNSTNGTINAAYMTQVANVVDWALARGMYVIINDHWDKGWFERNDFNSYDRNLNSKLISIWTQVANRFKWYDSDRLSFACANEPGAATQAQVNVLYQYYQNWVNAMRANGGGNSVRWLVVQAPCPWNWDILLNHGLNMPADSAGKLMIETHTYDPGEFTVQGSDEDWRSMKYFWGNAYHVSGDLAYRNCTSQQEGYLQEQFTKLKTNFADRGYPVLIGEWAGQPKPELPELTGVYKDQNFRSVTYYNKFMANTIASFGFSGTFFSGQGDPFDPTTGAVQNWDKLNSILGISALPPIPGLSTTAPVAPAPVANGTYRLISRHSGKALDAMGTGDGTQIIQWPYWGGPMQQWTVTHTGNGQYSIIGVQSGKALDIEWGSTNDGAKVQLYSNWGGPMQKFTFTPTDSGYFRITPVSSPNSCLDVTGISTANGAAIQQWTYWGGAGQQWRIQYP
jgi:aryl-phospho-beta-D-glucosidase BglC (GH1 family)